MAIVEGKIAVKAVLESKYRKVNKVIIQTDKSSKDISYIVDLAKKKKIEVSRVSKEKIEELSIGKTHGGILADVNERKCQSLMSLLKNEQPFLAYLEGIEDSYNLGYIFRTLYAFGCDGVILKERYTDFSDLNLLKSSAGASELLPIVYSDDVISTMEILKNNQIRIIGAYRGKGSICLYDYDFVDKGILVAIGGPLRGLSSEELKMCDDFIYIPYANDFHNALNAASATSVIAGEIYRQKYQKTTGGR